MNNMDPKNKPVLSEGENYDKDGRIVNTENPDYDATGADSSIRTDTTNLPEQETETNENEKGADQHEEFIDKQNDEEVEE